VQTVIAAQAGDAEALDSLLASYLPLIYNIVGRGLSGHADVDDVVQETMLRAVRGLGDLRDPAAFRSWLVAVAIRQMRDHYRARQAVAAADLSDEVADPEADFVELTILRLGLSSQREETAQATRWLDAGDRELLALWWLEAAGELDRNELVAALGLPATHVAVRIGRLKEQLTTCRVVVRALRAEPPCPGLEFTIADWDGVPSPLWRKRIARHIRACGRCGAQHDGLIPAERLLAGLTLVPLPGAMARAYTLRVGAGAPGPRRPDRHHAPALTRPAPRDRHHATGAHATRAPGARRASRHARIPLGRAGRFRAAGRRHGRGYLRGAFTRPWSARTPTGRGLPARYRPPRRPAYAAGHPGSRLAVPKPVRAPAHPAPAPPLRPATPRRASPRGPSPGPGRPWSSRERPGITPGPPHPPWGSAAQAVLVSCL
jgi:RNA polymerase sigma factor (sigma-70 family)